MIADLVSKSLSTDPNDRPTAREAYDEIRSWRTARIQVRICHFQCEARSNGSTSGDFAYSCVIRLHLTGAVVL